MIFYEKSRDEVLRLARDAAESLVIELPLAGLNLEERVTWCIAVERREPTESAQPEPDMSAGVQGLDTIRWLFHRQIQHRYH